MTSNYQATPLQWALVASEAADGSAMDACILELRRRMEALESVGRVRDLAEMAEDAVTGRTVRFLANAQPLKVETSYGEANAHAKDLLRTISARPVMVEGSFDLHGMEYQYKAEAQPAANAQKPTLVDRVADAIAAVDDEGLTNMTWSSHSQAAIRVVAEWVRENPGPNSAWPAVARDLMDEASR